jgi:hypothetical protein
MRYFIILLLIGSIPLRAICQTAPVQLWEASEFVENFQIKGPTIQLDKFQNTYMLTPQKDVNPFTGFTLVKYDTVGNALWNVNYPPGIIGQLYGSFTLDSLGYSYVGIWFDGGLPNYDADALLVKYSPEGETIWERNYGLNQAGDSYIFYSEMDSLGRLIVLGMNLSDAEEADNFLFISCLDVANGDTLWRTTIPGIYYPQNLKICNDRIEALVTQYLPDSKYYGIVQLDFSGQVFQHFSKPYSGHEIDFNHISKNGEVLLGNRSFGYNVTKLNPEGDTLWRYKLPEGDGLVGQKVLYVNDDSGGYIYATGNRVDSILGTQALTTKFTSDGEVLWQKPYDLELGNFGDGSGYVTTDSNFVYTTGSAQRADGVNLLFILVHDKISGEIIYEILLEHGKVHSGVKVIPVNGDLIYLGWTHEQTSTSLNVVTGCFRLPKITSTVEVGSSISNISIFPNPTADWIQITDIDTQIFKQMVIYDASGQMVKNIEVDGSSLHFSLSSFPAGTYIIALKGVGVRLNKKVVKQ